VIAGRAGCVAFRLVDLDTCSANKLIAEHTTTRETNDLICGLSWWKRIEASEKLNCE
jgi:hypothetical protein